MTRSPYAKAILAVLAGAATPLAAAFTANGALTSADLYTAFFTAVVSGGAVFGVKNGAAKDAVAGLVVKVVADLDKFKAALDVALSQSLVIAPQPVAAVSAPWVGSNSTGANGLPTPPTPLVTGVISGPSGPLAPTPPVVG